jgi:hypothetical protein
VLEIKPGEQVQFNTQALKQENYTQTMDDSNFEVDAKLGLGTGDDELVENIVKSAKTSMGLGGMFIDEKTVANQLK